MNTSPKQTKSQIGALSVLKSSLQKRVADRTAESLDRRAVERTRLIAEALIDQLAKSDDGRPLDPRASDRINKLRDSSKLLEPVHVHSEIERREVRTALPSPFVRTKQDMEAIKSDLNSENRLTPPAAAEPQNTEPNMPQRPQHQLKERIESNEKPKLFGWLQGWGRPAKAKT
jgi:hypothetical protein